jgi:hypothetical protein
MAEKKNFLMGEEEFAFLLQRLRQNDPFEEGRLDLSGAGEIFFYLLCFLYLTEKQAGKK